MNVLSCYFLQTTEDETSEEFANGLTDKKRKGKKKKKQLTSQPLQPPQENSPNDELATKLTNSLLEYSANGIVSPQRCIATLPPSPSDYSPISTPTSFLVRTNSTSSISDSTFFNLRVTPSASPESLSHDHNLTPSPPSPPLSPPPSPSLPVSLSLDTVITCNQTGNNNVSLSTYPPQKHTHAKRKIFGLNCLSSKFPSTFMSPQKSAKKKKKFKPLQKKTTKLNFKEVHEPLEKCNHNEDLSVFRTQENGTEKVIDLETDVRSDEYLSQRSVTRMRESAASLLYKDLLLNWQHELNKQRDGTDDIIIVENLYDRVLPPVDFKYISSNQYSDGVPDPSSLEVSSSLCGCECYALGKKCGTRSATFCCPTMACATFAYTKAGKVRVPPGTPIYECNSKCSCPPDCINKVVQHGRKIPLCIFRTENGRGWGVKTMQPIRAHSFLTEYVGEVISSEEAEKRGHLYDEKGTTYLFDLDFDDDNSEFTIDATKMGNVSHFFNHSVRYQDGNYIHTVCANVL